VFARGLDPYFAGPGKTKEGSLRHWMDVIDDYLDVAIEDGWLDD
jgi:hypothetical protein